MSGILLSLYFMVSAVLSAWISATSVQMNEINTHLAYVKCAMSLGIIVLTVLLFFVTRGRTGRN
jgi:hypothetical protein